MSGPGSRSSSGTESPSSPESPSGAGSEPGSVHGAASRTFAGRSPGERGASPVVGVVLVVAVTVLLAATVAVGVGAYAAAEREPPPWVGVTGTLSADDGWPDGQVLELTHKAGGRLRVSDLELVVRLLRTDERARLSGFPTRRLTDDHVEGVAVFDESYAGIDGELDAAHTDGWWESGETAEVRIASGDHDVKPGEAVRVRIVHLPTNTVVASQRVVAG